MPFPGIYKKSEKNRETAHMQAHPADCGHFDCVVDGIGVKILAIACLL
jgi:hypothetical protein